MNLIFTFVIKIHVQIFPEKVSFAIDEIVSDKSGSSSNTPVIQNSGSEVIHPNSSPNNIKNRIPSFIGFNQLEYY